MSSKQEIVIFSPGRRASRAILVRVQEFVNVAGFEDNILEYNQEQLRVRTLDGQISTVRSFPSKKQVRARNREMWESERGEGEDLNRLTSKATFALSIRIHKYLNYMQ